MSPETPRNDGKSKIGPNKKAILGDDPKDEKPKEKAQSDTLNDPEEQLVKRKKKD